ncbi:NADH-quinone oxidoreductase subunit L [Thiofilum flexile]|uniref:NADH-quinone oxidoreductase subunit L n=1 Tax=Thiofilum flexile TaxID=125627 RepID=UPI0003807334|nr:NADH-quinone oxidoreductase subunit L [Thiofilum flexile]
MNTIYIIIVLLPLIGAIAAGFFGKQLGRIPSHRLTSGLVGLSFLLSLYVLYYFLQFDPNHDVNVQVYRWATIGRIELEVGFFIDRLTVFMMVIVTFVSLMVHIYTIGYMHDDPGYQRFFSYISLFTFAMLMLVMSNNFVQLFFGWEAVGLVSYLLIGFWYKKDTAIYANMKAFLVNRVGDIGLLLGIAVIIVNVSGLVNLRYEDVFERLFVRSHSYVLDLPVPEIASILLLIGAMGKSAQIPLHVWLPDSMEGPTPISALIHAATMVTAGIFLIARMSPIFENAEWTLNAILVIGSSTAFFMGLVGMVQNDIKRVIAYSTLSQLGYMMTALGASVYSAGLFHLMTHAFFKALLFLAAGSVIMGMHHEQDIRKMGGLRRYMPVTYITFLIGSLALVGFPGFSGFFSKDLVIEAVKLSDQPAALYAYVLLVLGVFVTAFYTFRVFFMVFHGDERMDDHTLEHLHESPRVVLIPLILLAIPAIFMGLYVESVGLGSFFGDALIMGEQSKLVHIENIVRTETHVLHRTDSLLQEDYHGIGNFILHGMMSLPFILMLAGIGSAWYLYLKNDNALLWLNNKLKAPRKILENQYYFDKFNQGFFAKGALYLGNSFMTLIERMIIDGLLVNGVARAVTWATGKVRLLQTGYLYHSALAMIVGIIAMVTWFITLLW